MKTKRKYKYRVAVSKIYDVESRNRLTEAEVLSDKAEWCYIETDIVVTEWCEESIKENK